VAKIPSPKGNVFVFVTRGGNRGWQGRNIVQLVKTGCETTSKILGLWAKGKKGTFDRAGKRPRRGL